MRPLRPPRSLTPFSENQKRCGFGQCAVFAGKLAFQTLDPLFFFLGRLTQTGSARTVPVICLLASRSPRRDLRRIETALAAVFCQISFVQCRRFQHRRELVARRPTLRASVSVRQKLPLAARLSTPLVQCGLGNPFILRKLPNGQVIRRQHPLQNSRFSFW